MGNNAGQISENTLQAMEIIAQSVVDQAETSITRDCVVAEIVDVAAGLYTVSSGYSSFSAYSLNQAQYAIGDLVYVQMPAGSGSGDKIILGRRQSGSDAYEFADAFADTVFFNGRENSLIKLTSPAGLIANGDTKSIHLGAWTGEYAGVTKLGLEGNFNTLLKTLGAVEGVYGLKLVTKNNVGNLEEFDFPCSEYYGNPYNYIYSTRVNKLFTYTTQQTLVQIDAYVYQNSDFRDDDEILIAVAQSANILLDNLYVGVGKLGSEILDSKLTITPYNGSRVYAEGGDATLITVFDTFVSKIGIESLAGQGTEAIQTAISNAETYDALNEGLKEGATPIQFTSTQITRINQWIESKDLITAIDEGAVSTDDFKTQGYNSILIDLSVEKPLITFSLVVNTEKVPEYLTTAPTFADESAKAEFIRWFKANREAEINNLTIPSELQSGWEMIETGVTEEGYLVFSPDFTKDSETLVALIYYKEKYYVSNELTMVNQVDATNKKIEDTKSELIDQAEKDREMIQANQNAINSLVIESGYFETDEVSGAVAFRQNNGLFYYYTRSGVIRENDKGRAYGLRCYSSDENTVIQSLTWKFPDGNTMLRSHEDGYYQESGDGIYPRSLITIDRKYNPGKTNNIVVVTAECSVTSGGATRQVTLENQIELLFGYYSCEGTEHTLTAYWKNVRSGEVVNCLVPGNSYQSILILDGKEVTSPKWLNDISGDLGDIYSPQSVNEVHMRKGIVTLSDDLSLGCWLGAKLSYNEDNIIEGMTQLIYQSDGTTHMRDGAAEADVTPQYRLELLLEDTPSGNQQYADGIYWDPYSGEKLSDKEIYERLEQESRKPNTENSTTDANGNETKKELVNGFSYDENGEKTVMYFSGPSNWSIGVHRLNGALIEEYFMRDVDSDYSQWVNGTSADCPYFSLVYSPSGSKESVLLRSTVDLQMKGVYIETMSNYLFTINIYSYVGYLLARIPLRIEINKYPSIYIDKMAQYDGGIKIEESLGTIYTPRFLAGKYEAPDNVGNTGNKQFTGVAIGDFKDPETEASMQLTGIYGFKTGKQAYAFREDGTGFIGANSNTRITFNNGGPDEEVLTIGDISSPVFAVQADGDVTLKGTVTGGSPTSGYQLNKDGTGYIISNKGYGIYFEPNYYPIYISNPANKDYPQKAPFSVDKAGNVNLRGSNVNINTGNIIMTGTSGVSISNGQNILNMDSDGLEISNGNNSVKIKSDGISLTGSIKFDNDAKNSVNDIVDIDLSNYATKSDVSGAKYELTADKLKVALDDIDGNNLLTYDSQGNLYIKATALAAQYLESDVIDVHGALRTRDYDLKFITGRLGSGSGQGENNTTTYGVGIAADPLYPTQLGPKDIPARWENGQIVEYLEGGYTFVTNGGARIGYYSNNKNHTALVIDEGQVVIQYFENGVWKQGTTLWKKT